MITEEKFLDEYIEAGSDIISFHLETDEDIEKLLQELKKGLKCGLAIKTILGLKSNHI